MRGSKRRVRTASWISSPRRGRCWCASTRPCFRSPRHARGSASTTTDAASARPVRADAVELEVVYDGADLAETAELLGLSADELVRRHTSVEWTVAFTGFAPGFGYLVSPDWTFDVPRLPSPRTRVPRGAVGLAGRFSGAYPRETPGGWRLIGTTSAALFDPDAPRPALLAPGAPRPFPRRRRAGPRPGLRPWPGRETATAGPDSGQTPQSRRPDEVSRQEGPGVRIVEPGLLATLQDLGRPGSASLGVAPSGALDRGSARTANRLVGNPEDAAVIEATMGGLRAVASRDLWFAVTGAWGPIRLAGHEVDPYEAHEWPTGAELHIDWFEHGARGYLAVRGGFGGAPVLGSRSTDVLAGIGPNPLRAGDELTVGPDPSSADPGRGGGALGRAARRRARGGARPRPAGGLVRGIRPCGIVRGRCGRSRTPRTGWACGWTDPRSARVRDDELPSEGMVPGALQVPPSGRPTILLADGPVTGGYPVIAVATDAALDLLAQARPGTRLRFRHARVT